MECYICHEPITEKDEQDCYTIHGDGGDLVGAIHKGCF